jgi:hypothetical protein
LFEKIVRGKTGGHTKRGKIMDQFEKALKNLPGFSFGS